MTPADLAGTSARPIAQPVSMSVLAADAGHFFRLPIPAFVWERTKSVLEPEFVTFVDEAVAADASKQKSPSINDGKAVIKPSGE